MALKVTFDTNVFTRFIHLKENSDKIVYEKILEAIKSEIIRGYFSDTFVSLEGVVQIQREKIFGGRRITSLNTSEPPNIITISIGASMCKPDLHEKHLRDVTSLLELGLRGLRGQAYLGDNFLVPSNMEIYENTPIDELIKYREKMGKAERAIANKNQITGKNVGKCRARELGLHWLKRDNRSGEIWYQGLGLAKYKNEYKNESKEVVMAVAEWADGESIIRHIGYGNNYFCTSDKGNSANGPSIFDGDHKKWLACEFGVNFVTPNELIGVISAM